MEYKGYVGVLEVDDEAGVIFGRVIGLRDVITFQGESVAEARQAFHDSIDDYLEFCARRGEEPDRTFSGKFLVRVDSELHRAMVQEAEMRGISLNALVDEALTEKFGWGNIPSVRGAKPPSTAVVKGRSKARDKKGVQAHEGRADRPE